MVLCQSAVASLQLFSLSLEAPSLDQDQEASNSSQQVCLHLSYGSQGLAVEQLRADVLRCHEQLSQYSSSGRIEAAELAAALANGAWQACVRSTKGAATANASCFRELRHSFVCVHTQQQQLIVDPHFRDAFLIPHPTKQYQALLQQVDEVFVGTPAQLHAVVTQVAHEMAASFAQQGLTLPPWRRCSSLLSKWLPLRCTDVGADGLPAPASPLAVAGPLAGTAAQPAVSGASDAPSVAASEAGSPFSRLDDSVLASEARRTSASSLSRMLSGSTRTRSVSETNAAATGARLGSQRRASLDAGVLQACAPCHPDLPRTYRVRLGLRAGTQ